MPLNSDTDKSSGALYVVALPIGNPDDISRRALDTLSAADVVLAEDTRDTGRLLSHYGLKKPMISFHEHNEAQRAEQALDMLARGKRLALVSDAGTPAVSDPGYALISAAAQGGFRVVPLPGPNAALAALCASGLATDSFLFAGFLPKKKGKRTTRLNDLAARPETLVFYESPRRILEFLGEVEAAMGDRRASLARELTKTHEEFVRGKLSEIRNNLEKRPKVLGECTLVVEGASREVALSRENMARLLASELSQAKEPLSRMCARIARETGWKKDAVYKLALSLSKHSGG